MMKDKVHFETLGCRLNQDESEGAARSFDQNGFTIDLEPVTGASEQNQEVILAVLNTCTVTSKAEQKARRLIRLMLEKYPDAVILVTGCYAQVSAEEIKSINPERIAVLGGLQKYLLNEIAVYFKDKKDSLNVINLEEFLSGKKNPADEVSEKPFTLYTPVFQKHSRPSVKIQDGCNNNCAFCKIHQARGKSISLDVEEVLKRVKELESKDAAEVVFTGVNLSQYKGLTKNNYYMDFCALLKYLLKETNKIHFRISSFYPQHITEELSEVLASSRVQPFFHLSVQSGSNRILHLMNRPYDCDSVLKAVELLRKAKNNPFISCDIIAGFPGETEEDFEETKKMCSSINFAWIHAFPYSPRKGTAAYSMKPQIPERIKDERVKWLMENAVQNKISYIKSFAGKEIEAVAENSRSLRLMKNQNDSSVIHGVTDNFIHVELWTKEKILPGDKITVVIREPLEENIRNGKETEAFAEFVNRL